MLMKNKHSLNYEEKAEFLVRTGKLLEQGYTISDCIDFFLKYEKKKLKPALYVMLQQLQNGSSFSDTLVVLQMPKNIISFVYYAEHYGDLAHGLIKGGDLLRKIEENKRKLEKLLKYPIFLLWIITVFSIILYQYLFPQFLLLFSSINIQLPFISRIFLYIIDQLPYYFATTFILAFLLLTYFIFVIRKKGGIYKARLICRFPIIGHFYRVMITYYFSINLSCLIKSGMSILEALSIFHKQESEKYVGEEAQQIIMKLEKGEPLHLALIDNTVYLKELAYIVDHGQANGRLDEELDHYSQWLLEEFDHKLKKIFMIIQPTLFLFIGITVLLMFASVLLPIFSLIEGL